MCWKVLLKPRSQMLDMDKKRLFLMLASAPPPVKLRVLPEGGKGLWSSRRVLFFLEVALCRQNVMALRSDALAPRPQK